MWKFRRIRFLQNFGFGQSEGTFLSSSFRILIMGFPKESIRSVVSADDGNLKSRHKAIQRFTQNEQCEVCLGIGRLFFGSSRWNFASKAARDFVGSMISTKSLNWKNVSQMTDADHAWTGYDRSHSAEHLPLSSSPSVRILQHGVGALSRVASGCVSRSLRASALLSPRVCIVQ